MTIDIIVREEVEIWREAGSIHKLELIGMFKLIDSSRNPPTGLKYIICGNVRDGDRRTS